MARTRRERKFASVLLYLVALVFLVGAIPFVLDALGLAYEDRLPGSGLRPSWLQAFISLGLAAGALAWAEWLRRGTKTEPSKEDSAGDPNANVAEDDRP